MNTTKLLLAQEKAYDTRLVRQLCTNDVREPCGSLFSFSKAQINCLRFSLSSSLTAGISTAVLNTSWQVNTDANLKEDLEPCWS